MIIVIDVKENKFMGRSFNFNSLSGGRHEGVEADKRLYFDGATLAECLQKGNKYADEIESPVERFKLRQVLEDLEKYGKCTGRFDQIVV